MAQTITKHYRQTGKHFIEKLGNKIALEMVLIRGGSFMMGAPEDEEGSSKDEYPQHQVTVPPFFMGKYPVTQAQWKAVARLRKIKHPLKRDPSYFKGDNHPVEQVSWYDAVEFCDRLSQYTGRTYRLPSEAEWEYACRAGTTTPFHFGETITTDLANYCGVDSADGSWSGSYGVGPKGIYRKETTPVDYFQGANSFGLYDMHGNVWEWCADHWHSNYKGAPADGSAWIEVQTSNHDNRYRVLRSGSWNLNPNYCRSAYRHGYDPVNADGIIGLRVVCVVGRSPRTLM